MEVFHQIVENSREYAIEWKKRTGGKVVGYWETYFPEEVAYAGGMLPIRMMARHEPDDTSDRRIYGSCHPARDIYNQFCKGRYDYVDAIVNTEGCQWAYHSFEAVANEYPGIDSHYIFLPDYVNATTSKDVLRSELEVFKGKVEEWTGKVITDEDLDYAIEVYNTNRRLLRRLYNLRRDLQPRILGSEAMEIVLSSQLMDKAEMNPLLEKALDEIENREPGEDRTRLILIGSETSDVELEKLVETLGGDVVVDELDNGTSYCWNDAVWQKDRLMSIALRYLDRPHNPIKDNCWRRRPQHIFELCEDYFVDGAIVEKQVLCHLHGTDNYAVWKLLRERTIPFHFLERDTTVPFDETKVRIEAFLNMLRPGLNRLRGWSSPEMKEFADMIASTNEVIDITWEEYKKKKEEEE